jgi:hypothetical protein
VLRSCHVYSNYHNHYDHYSLLLGAYFHSGNYCIYPLTLTLTITPTSTDSFRCVFSQRKLFIICSINSVPT